MNPSPFLISAAAALFGIGSAVAAEITIEKRPFTIHHEFQARALPVDPTLLALDGKAWGDFEILEISPHGSRVKKDQLLVSFDPKTIDEKLEDLSRSIRANTQLIEQAELELKHLKETNPHLLEAARRAAEQAKQDHDYFVNVHRELRGQMADNELLRAEQSLENQREELRQLTKMYEADDLTEETEEIILTRQRDRVKDAEFAVHATKVRTAHVHEVDLPREAISLSNAARDTAIALLKIENEAPRNELQKALGLEALKTSLAREEEAMANLQSDRKQFEMKAPGDGWFFYGAMLDGEWTTGELLKVLVPNGRVAARRPFATFVPAQAKLVLHASLGPALARQLNGEESGKAWFEGREDQPFEVKFQHVSLAPEPDGRFAAKLSASWPDGLKLAPGLTANVQIIPYSQAMAVVVPTKALAPGPEGWTIEVKLADGKTGRRTVKRGRVLGDETEIVDGLEPGQVIIVP